MDCFDFWCIVTIYLFHFIRNTNTAYKILMLCDLLLDSFNSLLSDCSNRIRQIPIAVISRGFYNNLFCNNRIIFYYFTCCCMTQNACAHPCTQWYNTPWRIEAINSQYSKWDFLVKVRVIKASDIVELIQHNRTLTCS